MIVLALIAATVYAMIFVWSKEPLFLDPDKPLSPWVRLLAAPLGLLLVVGGLAEIKQREWGTASYWQFIPIATAFLVTAILIMVFVPFLNSGGRQGFWAKALIIPLGILFAVFASTLGGSDSYLKLVILGLGDLFYCSLIGVHVKDAEDLL